MSPKFICRILLLRCDLKWKCLRCMINYCQVLWPHLIEVLCNCWIKHITWYWQQLPWNILKVYFSNAWCLIDDLLQINMNLTVLIDLSHLSKLCRLAIGHIVLYIWMRWVDALLYDSSTEVFVCFEALLELFHFFAWRLRLRSVQ